jgi:lysophospholipase L1-like esterase
MKSKWHLKEGFWRGTALSALTLAGLAAAERAATVVYKLPQGRFPAMMIEVMSSRAISWVGVAGYYERIFNNARLRQVTTWENSSFVNDPFRLLRLRPNLATVTEWRTTNTPTNSFGYIGREWSQHKPPNTRRIALLGDSIAGGWGVALSQSFGSLLESRLNALHPNDTWQRFELLNFSVSGYNLPQMLDVAREDVPRFEPDVYVVALTELSVFRPWSSLLIHAIQLNRDLKYGFLREAAGRAGTSQRDDSLVLQAKLAPFRIPVIREALFEMKSNAELHHANFLVFLVPTVGDADLPRKRFEGIPELLRSLHINFVDVSDTFDGILDRQSFRYSRTDVHPSARGHAMIYNNLYAKLRAQPDAWSALVGSRPESAQEAKASSSGKRL